MNIFLLYLLQQETRVMNREQYKFDVFVIMPFFIYFFNNVSSTKDILLLLF